MIHQYKPRTELRPKRLDGISEDQIAQHWGLYEAYVRNVNMLNERLSGLIERSQFGLEFAELKRRLGFEYNGMILHEYYFAALAPGRAPLEHASELTKLLKQFWGGFETWKKEFVAIGKMRGIGWAVLYADPHRRALSNHWITLHEEGHPAGCLPVLVMDVWEHAYMVDFGAGGKVDYIDAFFKNVDWTRIERNLQEAIRLTTAV